MLRYIILSSLCRQCVHMSTVAVINVLSSTLRTWGSAHVVSVQLIFSTTLKLFHLTEIEVEFENFPCLTTSHVFYFLFRGQLRVCIQKSNAVGLVVKFEVVILTYVEVLSWSHFQELQKNKKYKNPLLAYVALFVDLCCETLIGEVNTKNERCNVMVIASRLL